MSSFTGGFQAEPSRHITSYDNLQEAYQLYKALLSSQKWYDFRKGFLGKKFGPRTVTRSPGDREFQRLCCQCGISMVEGARSIFDDDEKLVSLARDVEKEAATISDDFLHASSLVMLGKVLYSSGDRQEALRHLECAKLMGIGALNAEVYFWIAYVHHNEKRLPEALYAAEEAWKISETRNSLVNQAQTSYLLGTILFSANRDTEAWKFMEISLTKNLELGNRRDSAMTLEYMGYGYLRRGDYLNAYISYEAAAESYLGTVAEKQGCTKCKENMAKIKDMQKNPDLDIGFKRPRRDNNWPSLFYPGVAASV